MTGTMIVERINGMRVKETSLYLYSSFYKPSPLLNNEEVSSRINIRKDLGCRQRICNWAYSVIDYFDLSRTTAEITLSLFDRFLATRGERCTSREALLTSLSALYIAIKTNEKRRIKVHDLAQLSRSQFTAQDIEKMELEMLSSLSWLVHPPTAAEFISHLNMLIPPSVSVPMRNKVLDLSRYMAELSVCDAFFVEHDPSTVALASILDVLEDQVDYDEIPRDSREEFIHTVTNTCPWFADNVQAINDCRDRLRYLIWEQEGQHLPKQTNRASSPTAVCDSIRKE